MGTGSMDGCVDGKMDGWMDGGTDEGVLIRYLGKWMPFRRSLGLALRGGVCCGGLSDR